jgi:hypothetical protein
MHPLRQRACESLAVVSRAVKTVSITSAARTVTAPDGRVWTVRRRFPRGPRWWRPSAADIPWDLGLSGADDMGGVVAGIVAFVLLVILLGVLAFVILPAIVFLADAALILGGLLLLGGAWIIEASTPGQPREAKSWRVRGIFASRSAVAEVAGELERGDLDAAPDAATT